MKNVVALAFCFAIVQAVFAATPEQEKQFVATYQKAYDARDGKTLVGMLYTKGADPEALGFYKMMLEGGGSGKITSIALVDLTPEDKKKTEGMKGPDGRMMKLVLPATKKLVVKAATNEKDNKSTSSSEVFVGESGGKLYILVPAAK